MGDLENKKITVETVIDIDLVSSNFEEENEGAEDEGTPVRPILCLKNKLDMKEFEEKEDCFILDFDPDETLDITKLSVSKHTDNVVDSPDICVVAEKGQVACRDFPHSRHTCAKYPFEKTSHESFCELCYCFVCDVAAPCKDWTGTSGHCHATNNEAWKLERQNAQKLKTAKNNHLFHQRFLFP